LEALRICYRKQEAGDLTQGDQDKGGPDDYLLARLYGHFQVGGGKDLTITTSDLDFSSTSQKELGLTGMKPGETRGVNLFESGVDSNSLAFGKVTMVYEGNDFFQK
jgi:hypothetical protein